MHDLKAQAREIFTRTLAAVDIRRTLRRRLQRRGSRLEWDSGQLDLQDFQKIFVIAFGKAAEEMTAALLEELPPSPPPRGILVVPVEPRSRPDGFQIFVGGHPVPTEGSFQAARAALDLLAQADSQTLVFFLISGGGSALLELPLDPQISLEEMQQVHAALVSSDATIGEINCVRKHLSAVKGGRLAATAPEAFRLTLAISDVPRGQEAALASGPTLPDPSTLQELRAIVLRHRLMERFPPTIRARIEAGLPETPKPGDAALHHSSFVLLMDARDLLHAAHRVAGALGFCSICDDSTDNWMLERAADRLLALLAEHKAACSQRPVALLANGEILSPVRGSGRGGRNSAFVLYCVPRIAGRPVAVLSAGTDGIDGSSPAAGAVADGETLSRARALGLDPEEFFARSDSYTFFDRLGDAIVTGPTGHNLRDLRVLLYA